MARGKSAAVVNSRLRDELKIAQEARRRLEGRLERAERERDSAVERMNKIEESEHPAIEAERARADHAAEQIKHAVEAERDRWLALIEMARPMFRKIVDLLEEADAPIVDFNGIQAFSEMFGPELFRNSDRNTRRNVMNAAEVRRTARRSSGSDNEHWRDAATYLTGTKPVGSRARSKVAATRNAIRKNESD